MLIGREISVIGAGIAGLATARALAMRGARVAVFEQATELGEVGGGLQIAPNGVAVLDALGLAAEARARAVKSRAVVLCDGFSGRSVTRLDLARHAADQDFLLFHRADLVALLADAATQAGVALHLGAPAADRLPGLVIHADGLNSAGRALLNGPADPFFTGQTAWRAVIPGDDGPAEARVFLGPGMHLVTYPLRGGTLRNIVAVEERPVWDREGWRHRADPDEVRQSFGAFAPEVRALLDRLTTVYHWGLFRHPVAGLWQGQGRVLAGDAAHPTLPFLAQGANMALEDAWVLADCLARLPEDQALPAYQALRRPRVIRAIEAANANARAYHLRGLTRAAAHRALWLGSRLAPAAPLRRFDWLYRHDVTAPPAA